MDSRILTAPEAAKAYKIPEGTLAKWRHERRGPAYSKAGRKVLYRAVDMEKFLDSTRQETTGGL